MKGVGGPGGIVAGGDTEGGRSEERTVGGILKNAIGGRNRGKLNNCAYNNYRKRA